MIEQPTETPWAMSAARSPLTPYPNIYVGIHTGMPIAIDLVHNPLNVANSIMNLLYYLRTRARLI